MFCLSMQYPVSDSPVDRESLARARPVSYNVLYFRVERMPNMSGYVDDGAVAFVIPGRCDLKEKVFARPEGEIPYGHAGLGARATIWHESRHLEGNLDEVGINREFTGLFGYKFPFGSYHDPSRY